MLYLVLILTAGYFAWLLLERFLNERALASFLYVIHVNGIRGKTSVCRLLDAHLRGAGYAVFTKTTGSTPCWIDVAGREYVIRRHGPANILEQCAVIRRAHREKAQILIVECMAVKPELQRFAQEKIVKGRLNVITNVRYDHIFEMGESLEEIAESLSGTIPAGGVLFTADEAFFPYFQRKCQALGAEAVLCRKGPHAADENEAIACALGEWLQIPASSFQAHLASYHADFGAKKCYRTENGTFLNLFSVNDPQSTKLLLDASAPWENGLVLLYNNRADRPDRLLLFIRYFFRDVPYDRLMIMGEAQNLACRLLRRGGIDRVETVPDWKTAVARAGSMAVVGIGNIKGQAYEMIQAYEEGETQ